MKAPAESSVSEKPDVRTVAKELKEGRIDEAKRILTAVLIEDPGLPQGRLLGAQIAFKESDFDTAIRYGRSLRSDPDVGLSAAYIVCQAIDRLPSGRVDAELGSLEIRCLEQVIASRPETSLIRQLIRCLRGQGRFEESSSWLMALVKRSDATLRETTQLLKRKGFYPSSGPSPDSAAEKLNPLVQANDHFENERFLEAFELLRGATTDGQTKAAADALTLACLAELQRTTQFAEYWPTIDPKALQLSDTWAALGLVLIGDRNYEQAVGALLRSISLNPTHVSATRRLAEAFDALGRSDDAEQFRYRAVQLTKSQSRGQLIVEKPQDPQGAQALAEMLLELGRPFEALQWRLIATPASAVALRDQLKKQISVLASHPNAAEIEIESAYAGISPDAFPISFDKLSLERLRKHAASIPGDLASPALVDASALSFVDVAGERGVDFQYLLGESLELHPIPLYASIGGGIASLDYDADGFPDLYFAQAGCSPEKIPSKISSQLFRSVDGQFQTVELLANATDYSYSTGIATGDINQDGFPDLYLAAFGVNHVLINQGDGTFRDASLSLQTRQEWLTSSVAIADLNADNLPDLFDVNYIEREGALQPQTKDRDGRWIQQMPLTNFGQSDVVHLQKGNGQFRTSSIDETIAEPSTGLGLLVTDFDGDGTNETFVANDARANHFLRYDSASNRFQDQAASRGLAVGFGGVANACMGIAAGDFDRNGRVDLHVTNYSTEAVNLYLQDQSGNFRDSATRFGLDVASKPMVGFGTKAVDIDRNGWLDIITTNGHVFDRRDDGEVFRMPTQIFLSEGSSFRQAELDEQLSPERHGLQHPALGRSMTKADLNRDSSFDLIVGYLDRPSAIFEDRSSKSGQVIHLRLVGVTSERDAVGAIATMKSSAGSVTRWVTAGDGYMSSDESLIEFTIPQGSEIEHVQIQWPSGNVTRYETVTPNSLYLVLENENELWKLADFNR